MDATQANLSPLLSHTRANAAAAMRSGSVARSTSPPSPPAGSTSPSAACVLPPPFLPPRRRQPGDGAAPPLLSSPLLSPLHCCVIAGAGSLLQASTPLDFASPRPHMGTEPDLVIFFDCPEDEMVKRLLGRNQGRVDDNIETIKKRLKVFESLNIPVVDYYSSRGKIHKINATGNADEIFEAVGKLFSSLRL